jgi:hypothetical protein
MKNVCKYGVRLFRRTVATMQQVLLQTQRFAYPAFHNSNAPPTPCTEIMRLHTSKYTNPFSSACGALHLNYAAS